jgi:beta-mannosidase
MKSRYDLSTLDWTVEGYTPYLWKFERLYGGMGNNPRCIDVPAVPARVPGSVQGALRAAGILPDWNIGTNWRECEWVENRHWMYRTHLPDGWLDKQATFRLECLGLDYCGWVYVNNREVAEFKGTHIPHVFGITPYLADADNVLEIIFALPPRWLGQFGYSSQMTEWKTRFNYTWDWSPRLVQVGIWDSITLVALTGSEISTLDCTTDADPVKGTGNLEVKGTVNAGDSHSVKLILANESGTVQSGLFSLSQYQQGIRWDNLPVKLWWPNLAGEQPLYTLTCALLDGRGIELDRQQRRLGFKHVEWIPCEGAPDRKSVV